MSCPTPKHSAIRVSRLTRRYGRTTAPDEIDLEIGPGITGLLGPNGAGKTTLLSILATVAAPDAGPLAVLATTRLTPQRVEIRRRLSYLPQELGYHRHFTVAAFLDYVAILMEITHTGRRHAEVARVLAATDAATRPVVLFGGFAGLGLSELGDTWAWG